MTRRPWIGCVHGITLSSWMWFITVSGLSGGLRHKDSISAICKSKISGSPGISALGSMLSGSHWAAKDLHKSLDKAQLIVLVHKLGAQSQAHTWLHALHGFWIRDCLSRSCHVLHGLGVQFGHRTAWELESSFRPFPASFSSNSEDKVNWIGCVHGITLSPWMWKHSFFHCCLWLAGDVKKK